LNIKMLKCFIVEVFTCFIFL